MISMRKKTNKSIFYIRVLLCLATLINSESAISLPSRETNTPQFEHYLSVVNNSINNTSDVNKKNFPIDAIKSIESNTNNNTKIKQFNTLAQAYSKKQHTELSQTLYEKALILATKEGKERQIALQLEYISKNLRQLGRYENALDYATKALDIQRVRDDKERIIILLNNISIIYRRLSRYGQARRRCSCRRRRQWMQDHPKVPSSTSCTHRTRVSQQTWFCVAARLPESSS